MQFQTLEEPLLPLVAISQQTCSVYSPAKKTSLLLSQTNGAIPQKKGASWKRYSGIALLVGFLAGVYSWVESQVLPDMRLGIRNELQESEVEPLSKYWQSMNSLVLQRQEELKRGIQQMSKDRVLEK